MSWTKKVPWMVAAALLPTTAALAVSCSAGSGPEDVGSGAGSGGGSSGSGGTVNPGGSGGSPGGSAGSGGTSVLDGGSKDTGLDPDAACVGISQTANSKLLPADIIFALDNSGSMDEEAKFVQANMNIFSYGIPPHIDFHIVVITADSTDDNGICIDPPLGSGTCPGDSNPPLFLHVPQFVASSDSLDLILSKFGDYESSLRTQSVKHVVVVSDDNASLEASSFDQQFRDKLSDFGAAPEYTFHGIFSFSDPFPFACMNDPGSDPCCAPAVPWVYSADIGEEYAELVNMTGGVAGNLCLQDFAPVFNAVTAAVTQSTKLACEWDIPDPPDGETVDPNLVNVEYAANGNPPEAIGYVDSKAACANVQHGWYFDDPVNPTKVYVCPQTCEMLQNADDAQIDIIFGCIRRPADPK